MRLLYHDNVRAEITAWKKSNSFAFSDNHDDRNCKHPRRVTCTISRFDCFMKHAAYLTLSCCQCMLFISASLVTTSCHDANQVVIPTTAGVISDNKVASLHLRVFNGWLIIAYSFATLLTHSTENHWQTYLTRTEDWGDIHIKLIYFCGHGFSDDQLSDSWNKILYNWPFSPEI